MKIINTISICIAFSLGSYAQVTYPIVDTDVSDFYNNSAIISAPSIGSPFYGQDATHSGNQPSYSNNGDGTITDNVTGLTWEQDMGVKISYSDAITKAANSTLGGHTDWRVPTIKELYSLANFTGKCFGDNSVFMFIDTNYFNQPIGNTSIGEREIDGQTWSKTQYVGLIMKGDTAVFGYNFVDGRLKGYPKYNPQNGTPNTMYFRMVRGNISYGINNFVDNGNGTITDNATGLMWQQSDDGNSRNWEDALSYCENLSYGGHSDWRLPNAKELHSILDYSRSPLTTNSPAIDPLFSCALFNNPAGNPNYGYYWTSSPLQDGPTPYSDAVYICFGEGQGQMSLPPTNTPTIYDTHGAGAQRNDPKEVGSNTYPNYFGPQGDIQYVNNFVRAVRDASPTTSINESDLEHKINVYPNPVTQSLKIELSSEMTFNQIELFNLQGQLIHSIYDTSKSEAIIDVSYLEKGIYVLRTQTNQGNDTRKIIVK
jgi:hypothetical protein